MTHLSEGDPTQAINYEMPGHNDIYLQVSDPTWTTGKVDEDQPKRNNNISEHEILSRDGFEVESYVMQDEEREKRTVKYSDSTGATVMLSLQQISWSFCPKPNLPTNLGEKLVITILPKSDSHRYVFTLYIAPRN